MKFTTRDKMLSVSFVFGVLAVLTLMVVSFVVCVKHVRLDMNCTGHLKRAADANTVELAEQELKVALDYIDTHGLNHGFTSVVYQTPDEDVGFWSNNLHASYAELRHLPTNASSLERSNMLIKLRETLLDHNDRGESVTIPEGVELFPHNVAFAVVGWGSLFAVIAAAVFFLLLF